jgi:hypothetical protein
METTPHPAQVHFDSGRSDLLSLLRGFDPGPEGFAGAEAALLEALSDEYLFLIGHADAEVKNAWSGFYRRVSGVYRPGR